MSSLLNPVAYYRELAPGAPLDARQIFADVDVTHAYLGADPDSMTANKRAVERVREGKGDTLPVESVPASSLVATQSWLKRDRVDLFQGLKVPALPVVGRLGDTNYVLDGHHRLAGRLVAGDSTVQAHVLALQGGEVMTGKDFASGVSDVDLSLNVWYCADGHVHVRAMMDGTTCEQIVTDPGVIATIKEICRDDHGRFAPCGGSNASGGTGRSERERREGKADRMTHAHTLIGTAMAGPRPLHPAKAKELADHLATLTVKQLHDLRKHYGLKASGANKDALVAKLAERLGSHGAGKPAPTPATPAAVLHPGANVITGKPVAGVAIPYKHEQSWTTGKAESGVLNGIPFAPAPPKFWEKTKDVDVKEPAPARPINRAGVLIKEPDGRIWICQPTNSYGNRNHTLPGGGVEPGLTHQQNAMKEVWEETGLQVKITGYAGDFKDSNNGNNGRLYIGERIGGQPWDAKIEPSIINRATGKPAAESESVSLVTPERAQQLLHRTDDLAQLMVVHPPPLTTTTRGVGSEPLKKFVEAIAPKAEQYKSDKQAANQYPGNAELHVVREMRGFNEKPTVVSAKDFDALMAKGGHIEMLRGVQDFGSITAKEMLEQYRTGDHFPGHGVFGSGTYTDSNKGIDNAASRYGGQSYFRTNGELMRAALPKTAKIIKESELEKIVPKNPDAFKKYPKGKEADECWRGVHAALAGYDAIEVDGKSSRHGTYGKGFYVILNRGIMTVQDKAPPQGYTIR